MSGAVRALVLDFGGVLSLPQLRCSIETMRRLCRLSEESFRKEYQRHRREFDRGRLEAGEYWRKILKAGGVFPDEDLIRRLVEEDIRSWTRLNEPVVKWARGLIDRGYRTAILSNMPEVFYRYLMDAFPWIGEFSVQVFSCRLGMVKPEPAIYHECLHRLAVNPEESLFLDDGEANIQAARRIGMRGLLFTSPDQTAAILEREFNLAGPAPG